MKICFPCKSCLAIIAQVQTVTIGNTVELFYKNVDEEFSKEHIAQQHFAVTVIKYFSQNMHLNCLTKSKKARS